LKNDAQTSLVIRRDSTSKVQTYWQFCSCRCILIHAAMVTYGQQRTAGDQVRASISSSSGEGSGTKAGRLPSRPDSIRAIFIPAVAQKIGPAPNDFAHWSDE
jgi:hypothetical protein